MMHSIEWSTVFENHQNCLIWSLEKRKRAYIIAEILGKKVSAEFIAETELISAELFAV